MIVVIDRAAGEGWVTIGVAPTLAAAAALARTWQSEHRQDSVRLTTSDPTPRLVGMFAPLAGWAA
jgi:hypothetical protein